jgi:hypothetical protein
MLGRLRLDAPSNARTGKIDGMLVLWKCYEDKKINIHHNRCSGNNNLLRANVHLVGIPAFT